MRMTRRKRIALSVLLIFVVTICAMLGAITVKAGNEDRSAASVFYEYAMRIFLSGKNHRSEEKTYERIEKEGQKNETFTVPSFYKTIFNFETEYREEVEVCVFGYETCDTLVYYLHGGAFLYQPTIFHYRYCRVLSEELDACVIMPIYPKAPRFTYEHTLDTIYNIYNDATENGDYDTTVVMGDSAGASLTLTLGQYILENGGKAPDDLIALSPCLDMTLSNPEIEDFQKKDPMLNIKDLKLKLNVYFDGQTAKESYTVSPIYCDYAALPEVTVIMGEYEILVPDARRLKADLDQKGVSINYYEYAKMPHTFPLLTIREAHDALEKIKEHVDS
ncbi:MAG: alpha/beta hydrolase [Clostridia bacterium]|nr:alpha/beta hydrolase [Clostridia bacterium]